MERRDFLRTSAAVLIGFGLAPRRVLAQIEPEPVVKLNIVKPSNALIYPEEEIRFETALYEVSNWYLRQVGSTFEIKPGVRIVDLREAPTEQILSEGEEGWKTALKSVTGGLSTRKNTLDVIMAIGGGIHNRGGSWGFNGTSGYLVLGDLVRESINDRPNPETVTCSNSPHGDWQCTRPQALGVIAHELGHAFGVNHPTASEGNLRGRIMAGDIAAFPEEAILSPEEIQKLKASPFFTRR